MVIDGPDARLKSCVLFFLIFLFATIWRRTRHAPTSARRVTRPSTHTTSISRYRPLGAGNGASVFFSWSHGGPITRLDRSSMMHRTEPMMHCTRPMMHRTGPMMHRTELMMHRTRPMMHRAEPMMHRTRPMMHRAEPIKHDTRAFTPGRRAPQRHTPPVCPLERPPKEELPPQFPIWVVQGARSRGRTDVRPAFVLRRCALGKWGCLWGKWGSLWGEWGVHAKPDHCIPSGRFTGWPLF
jgi:hypothetical protein